MIDLTFAERLLTGAVLGYILAYTVFPLLMLAYAFLTPESWRKWGDK